MVTLSITREARSCSCRFNSRRGRVGTSTAVEIGTMRVTKKIDALYALSTDSIKYLVVPIVLVAFFTLPLLVLIGDMIGVM